MSLFTGNFSVVQISPENKPQKISINLTNPLVVSEGKCSDLALKGKILLKV